MGTLELLQEDFEEESEPYQELQHSLPNLKKLKVLIKKISRIDRFETVDYDGSSVILDINKSANDE